MSDTDRPDEEPAEAPRPPPREDEAPTTPTAPPPIPPRPAPRPGRASRAGRRSFDFGGVLGGTFRVYGRMLVSLLTLALLILGPLAAVQLFLFRDTFLALQNPDPRTIDAEEIQGIFLITGGVGLLQGVMNMVLAGAITYLVVRQQQGRPVSVGEALQRGFARFLPILGTTILISLIVVAMFVPAVALGALSGSLWVMFLLGVLTVIPVIPFVLSTYAAVPACAMEGLDPIESLKRSRALSIGYRGEVFGLVFVIYLIAGVVGMVVQGPFLVAGDHELLLYVQTLFPIVVTGPLTAVLIALMYVELRAVREGVDPAGILSVFD